MDLHFLPAEMLLHIFSFMNPPDLCQLTGQVCEKWLQLSYHSSLWKNLNIRGRTQSTYEILRVINYNSMARSIVFSRISDWTFAFSLSRYNNFQRIELKKCTFTEFNASQLVLAFPSIHYARIILKEKVKYCIISQIVRWWSLKGIEIDISNGEDDYGGYIYLQKMTDYCHNLENVILPLSMYIDNRSLLNFTKSLGTNLKTFKANFRDISQKRFKFFTYCPNITDLYLCEPNAMTGNDFLFLKELTKLEKLTLRSPSSLNSQDYINFFQNSIFLNLLDLEFDCCGTINNDCLKLMTNSCPNLRKLFISFCVSMTEDRIQHVVIGAKNIQIMDLYLLPLASAFLTQVSTNMPKLTELRVFTFNKVEDEALLELKSKRPKLIIKWKTV